MGAHLKVPLLWFCPQHSQFPGEDGSPPQETHPPPCWSSICKHWRFVQVTSSRLWSGHDWTTSQHKSHKQTHMCLYILRPVSPCSEESNVTLFPASGSKDDPFPPSPLQDAAHWAGSQHLQCHQWRRGLWK